VYQWSLELATSQQNLFHNASILGQQRIMQAHFQNWASLSE
jgi:hypothetical protein